MKTNTAQKIIDYIQRKGEATAHELSGYLGISPQALFRQLAKLIVQNKLKKIGKPPKVFYSMASIQNAPQGVNLEAVSTSQIDK